MRLQKGTLSSLWITLICLQPFTVFYVPFLSRRSRSLYATVIPIIHAQFLYWPRHCIRMIIFLCLYIIHLRYLYFLKPTIVISVAAAKSESYAAAFFQTISLLCRKMYQTTIRVVYPNILTGGGLSVKCSKTFLSFVCPQTDLLEL
ncbi:hypothetical protein DFS34DRAFT_234774 [Phlyctochytrium arcticum]|nr:hypothetical protein DFS34DRAFT_234774 [Phlyctochytrium arcticum]